jgi:hypothetical protein
MVTIFFFLVLPIRIVRLIQLLSDLLNMSILTHFMKNFHSYSAFPSIFAIIWNHLSTSVALGLLFNLWPSRLFTLFENIIASIIGIILFCLDLELDNLWFALSCALLVHFRIFRLTTSTCQTHVLELITQDGLS